MILRKSLSFKLRHKKPLVIKTGCFHHLQHSEKSDTNTPFTAVSKSIPIYMPDSRTRCDGVSVLIFPSYRSSPFSSTSKATLLWFSKASCSMVKKPSFAFNVRRQSITSSISSLPFQLWKSLLNQSRFSHPRLPAQYGKNCIP